jgi:hypothetical protein
MRVCGISDRQGVRAFWRRLLLCVLLAVAAPHPEAGLVAGHPHGAAHAHPVVSLEISPEAHPDSACQLLCPVVPAILPPATGVAICPASDVGFDYADGPAPRGHTVDPRQHLPKPLQTA